MTHVLTAEGIRSARGLSTQPDLFSWVNSETEDFRITMENYIKTDMQGMILAGSSV
jgi:hypothetical protein